jgi:hypothetical protein
MDKPRESRASLLVCLMIAGITVFGIATWKAKAQQAQTASINGVLSQNIVMNGVFPLYDPSGNLIANGRCVQAIVTSNASGQWSVNYSAMGFTSITSFRAQAANPTTSLTLLSNQYQTAMTPPTLTTFAGTVTTTTAITILSISVPILQFASTATQVSVGVCGS